MTRTPSPDSPILTDGLRRFFDSEVENYCVAVRQGDIDTLHGEHPTLGWVFDSLQQADFDIHCTWLGIPDDLSLEDRAMSLCHEFLAFASLVLTYGADAAVIDFLPDA